MKEKILVIDDEMKILALLSEVLQDKGYDVVNAKDGVEGLKMFQGETPGLVVTDVKMTRKNGLDVLKGIKNLESDVDVIIITGHSDEAIEIGCLPAGAYDYLLKPVEDIEALLTAVERVIQKRNLKKRNKLLMQQLEGKAIRDPLTGLYNFRHLHVFLDEELIRSERYNHSFCILMIDIDHFKLINDTYGHQFGDHVLKKLGEIMAVITRPTDQIFRYGGEEFVIITTETNHGEIITAVDRLMDAVRNHTFVYEELEARITVSIGCACFPVQSTNKVELMKIADQALYKAKNAGRNRFIYDDIIND